MKDIIENNKLIAEFMGVRIKKDINKKNNKYNVLNKYYLKHRGNNIYTNINQFKYHLSYDWLTPVINRIRQKSYLVKTIYVPYKTIVTIRHIKDEKTILFTSINSDNIKAFYQIAIEFIKWYNKNK